eukprot:TRINITY_DN21941_c0_g1_i1.p1 TRINITY_DN21941_c0_g1~~TRINITY_DN21941_c0_g1_i1.p1  ORF type:complete len:306 (+),score=15.98 TRINITY_DN21941_c0_g1_i1:118-1035(+)
METKPYSDHSIVAPIPQTTDAVSVAINAALSSPTKIRVKVETLVVEKYPTVYKIGCAHGPLIATWIATIPLQIITALLYCILFGIQGIKEWEWRTKPIPMMLIISTVAVFILLYGPSFFHTFTLLGLILSLAGDIILINEGDDHFLLGLCVFLLAHIMYIVAFSVRPRKNYPRVGMHYMRAIPFVAVGSVITSILTTKLPRDNMILFGGVCAYGFILIIMGWRASARIGYHGETKSSQMIALAGAILFIISDCLLAFNKFHTPIPFAQIFVLSTYWMGQSLIAFSLQRIPWDQHKHVHWQATTHM